jgi:hypothetical protein
MQLGVYILKFRLVDTKEEDEADALVSTNSEINCPPVKNNQSLF